jgi:Spy/CpxP family protein refolding chaperone
MICLALGLGVLGFAAMRHARRCRHYYWHHHGYGGSDSCGGPPWHHHWRGGMGRRGLYMALSHLDASPAQERAIIGEVDKLRSRLRETKGSVKDARADLAAAIRGSVLDDAALGAVLGRVDAATGDARAAVIEALRNIHGVLDDRQRSELADLLDKGWWRRGGGHPYRV